MVTAMFVILVDTKCLYMYCSWQLYAWLNSAIYVCGLKDIDEV